MFRPRILLNKNVQQGYQITCSIANGQNRLLSSSSRNPTQQPSSSQSPARSSPSPSTTRFDVYTPPSRKKWKKSQNKRSNTELSPQTSRFSIPIATLKEKLILRDTDGALAVWNDLKVQNGLSEVEDNERTALIKLSFHTKGEKYSRFLKSIYEDFLRNAQWKSAIYTLGTLINIGNYKELWELITKSLESRDVKIPPSAFEGIIICACIVAAHLPGSPIERIANLVRPLEPIWLKYRREDSERIHGSPLSTFTDMRRFMTLSGNDKKIAEIAKTCYQHAILAWGLDYRGEEGELGTALLSHRITNTCNSNNFVSIGQLIEIIPKAQSQWLSMSFDNQTPADWTCHTWAALIQGLLSHRNTDLAGKAWKMYSELKPNNEPVHVSVWNGLLQGYSASKQWDQAKLVWQQMLDSKAEPDQYLYTTMIAMYFRARLPNEALLIFEELKEKIRERQGSITIPPVNAVILGYCFSDRISDAANLVNEMIKRNDPILPFPNINTMNTMLRAYGRHNSMEGIVQVLRLIGDLKLQADAYTFTTVLDAFTRMGHSEFVTDVFDLMVKEGIPPNEVTFSAIIKNALHTRNDDGMYKLDMALITLYQMERKGPPPTEISYTNTIAAILNNPNDFGYFMRSNKLPQGYQWQDVENAEIADKKMLTLLKKVRPEVPMALLAYERIKLNKLQPNRKTFNTLFDGILRYSAADEEEVESENELRNPTINLWCIQTAKRLMDEMQNIYSIDISGRTEFAITDGLQSLARSSDKMVQEEAYKCMITVQDILKKRSEGEQKNLNTINQEEEEN